MSKSLAIRGGDLYLGRGRAFHVATGQDKLLQDLKCWLLERVGTDPATPSFGSRLDGGIENGRIVVGLVGQIMSEEAMFEIQSQIMNLVNRYRTLQLEKIQQEISQLGMTTITPDETISKVLRVDVVPLGDAMFAKVKLLTLAESPISLVIPVVTTA